MSIFFVASGSVLSQGQLTRSRQLARALAKPLGKVAGHRVVLPLLNGKQGMICVYFVDLWFEINVFFLIVDFEQPLPRCLLCAPTLLLFQHNLISFANVTFKSRMLFVARMAL